MRSALDTFENRGIDMSEGLEVGVRGKDNNEKKIMQLRYCHALHLFYA